MEGKAALRFFGANGIVKQRGDAKKAQTKNEASDPKKLPIGSAIVYDLEKDRLESTGLRRYIKKIEEEGVLSVAALIRSFCEALKSDDSDNVQPLVRTALQATIRQLEKNVSSEDIKGEEAPNHFDFAISHLTVVAVKVERVNRYKSALEQLAQQGSATAAKREGKFNAVKQKIYHRLMLNLLNFFEQTLFADAKSFLSVLKPPQLQAKITDSEMVHLLKEDKIDELLTKCDATPDKLDANITTKLIFALAYFDCLAHALASVCIAKLNNISQCIYKDISQNVIAKFFIDSLQDIFQAEEDMLAPALLYDKLCKTVAELKGAHLRKAETTYMHGGKGKRQIPQVTEEPVEYIRVASKII